MVFGIYCRKSVVSDKGESVENQLDMCVKYIMDKFGDENEIIVYEDEGYSGKNTLRPMFMKMEEDIKRRRLDYVICYRLDRMSRSVSDFSALVEMMNSHKTGLICIKEEFDTSKPMGKAMMYMASVFSQLERETIAERVRDNMLLLARDGRWLGGNTPLGYKTERDIYINGDKKKYFSRLKEDESLDTVKNIYSVFIGCGNFKETAEIINAMGFVTKQKKEFTSLSVKDILENPVYCRADKEAFDYWENKGIAVYGEVCEYGLIAYNKKDEAIIAVGSHMPAVAGEIWVRVQEMTENKSYLKNRSISKGKALASGEIVCGMCGGKMYAVKRNGDGFDYICKNKRYGHICTSKNLNGIKADEKIKAYLKKDTLMNMKKEVRQKLMLRAENGYLHIETK